MKAASYNIMSGGFSAYDYTLKSPERMDLLIKAVKKIDADFISLIDTFRWDEIYSEEKLGMLFGYPYVYCLNLDDDRLRKLGHNNGLTVLTRNKVSNFASVRLNNRNAIKTVVDNGGKIFNLFTVYLDDLSEDVRLMQARTLMKTVNPNIPTVIMGDLNSFSPKNRERIKVRLDNLYKSHPGLKKKYSPILDQMEKAKTISLIENSGFTDTDKESIPTAPTPLWGINDLSAFLKIDYIFVSADIKFTNFQVHRGSFFDKAADHYPISVEIE